MGSGTLGGSPKGKALGRDYDEIRRPQQYGSEYDEDGRDYDGIRRPQQYGSEYDEDEALR